MSERDAAQAAPGPGVYDFSGDDEGREAGRVEVVAKGHDGVVTVRRLDGGEIFLAPWDALKPAEG